MSFAAEPLLKFNLNFPERCEGVLAYKNEWKEATHVTATFKSSTRLPDSSVLTVFTKDNDNLWRQIRMSCPKAGEDGSFSVTFPVRGKEAVSTWTPCGHSRPWNSLTPANILQYGFIFEQETGVTSSFTGVIELVSISTESKTLAHYSSKVRGLGVEPSNPEIGGIVEVTFRLDCWPSAPFDSEKTKITGTVTTPAGNTEQVHGFYYEDFLYDAQEWDKTQCLTPVGEPCFKLRYCPRVAGAYKLDIACEVDGEAFSVPTIEFDARQNEEYHGFVKVDEKNKLFFVYDDGTPYWGLGMNVRSPYDNRYKDVAPYSTWQDMGLAAYDMLFAKYEAVGINIVEVWMCSWWLAMEWINDAPGFHGVGHYNQYRAWMLDHIFRLARKHGIRLILVINNHGKFAMHYDTEWKRNPYNKVNGGYLTNCEEYYTNERARKDTKKLLDYVSARWGNTPVLLAWKLFTEVDLTGPDLNYYTNPVVAAWHKEMAAYLKQIDVYKHPITTHWMLSYQRINRDIAILPELDFLTTDAYYSLGQGTGGLISLLKGARNFTIPYAKPMAITEFGGSSYADNMTNLMKQVPIGLWTGFFNDMSILPMYWWFALVEDKDLYSNYKAISAFGAKEDRRGMAIEYTVIPNTKLQMSTLKSKTRILAWLFDTDYYLSSTENLTPATVKELTVSLPAPEPGKYAIECWDSVNGKCIETREVEVKAEENTVSIVLPEFRMHAALKLYRK